jgi:hypothetical protein
MEYPSLFPEESVFKNYQDGKEVDLGGNNLKY